MYVAASVARLSPMSMGMMMTCLICCSIPGGSSFGSSCPVSSLSSVMGVVSMYPKPSTELIMRSICSASTSFHRCLFSV